MVGAQREAQVWKGSVCVMRGVRSACVEVRVSGSKGQRSLVNGSV